MTPNQRHSLVPKGQETHSPIPRPVGFQHLRTFIFLSRTLVKKVDFTRWQSGESQGEVCTLWAWQKVSQGQTGPREPGGRAGRLERGRATSQPDVGGRKGGLQRPGEQPEGGAVGQGGHRSLQDMPGYLGQVREGGRGVGAGGGCNKDRQGWDD